MTRIARRIIRGVLAAAAVIAIAVAASTHLLSNAAMMLFDRSNVIPAESSIFTFDPYVINQGSSNYWLYGKDARYYYHFTYRDDAPYLFVPIANACPAFKADDVATWCDARKGAPVASRQ